MLVGVAAAQFGVGGDGQVALGAGGLLPVGAVGHDRGEHGLALPVGIVQGLVADRELLLPGGGVVVAAIADRCDLGAGADPGQAGFGSAGADLAELIADLLRRPGGLDGVGVAQVQQRAVGHAADVGGVGGAEGVEGLVLFERRRARPAVRRAGQAGWPGRGRLLVRPGSGRSGPVRARGTVAALSAAMPVAR